MFKCKVGNFKIWYLKLDFPKINRNGYSSIIWSGKILYIYIYIYILLEIEVLLIMDFMWMVKIN